MDPVNLSSPSSELSRSSTPSIPVLNNSNSPIDFVTRVLSPRVAVVSSQDADQVCQANNFPDFLTLIRPFGERIEGRGNTFFPLLTVIWSRVFFFLMLKNIYLCIFENI